MDLKIAIMSSHLNFTIENCFFKEKKYFKENCLQVWKYHPASVIVLAPNLCPMGMCSDVCEWSGSLLPALPPSLVCLSCSQSAGNLQQK